MKKIIVLFIVFLSGNCVAKTTVSGIIKDKNHNLNYYKPFKKFRNLDILSKIETSESGSFRIELDIKNPYFVQFVANDVSVNLLIEPNDSIFFECTPTQARKGNSDWLKITGNNSIGNAYFNVHYNFYPISKFNRVRELVDNYSNKSITDFISDFNNIQQKETFWVDSLLNLRQISSTFHKYVSKDIQGIIASEAIGQTEQFDIEEKKLQKQSTKASAIQDSIFKKYPPTDSILRFGLYGSFYLSDYYESLSKSVKIDQGKVICFDTPFIALASDVEQEYLWGRTIKSVATFAPTSFDLCKASNDYIKKFPENPFIEYLKEKDFCTPKITNPDEIKFIIPKENDVFSLLGRFPEQVIFIDMWATWCAPCKMEFRYYDQNLYDFFKEHNIECVFMSIDKLEILTKWQQEVKFFNLKGQNIILNEELVNSASDIFFDDGIISLPRYILINEKGKILTTNAPRPSNPNFKELIINLLK